MNRTVLIAAVAGIGFTCLPASLAATSATTSAPVAPAVVVSLAPMIAQQNGPSEAAANSPVPVERVMALGPLPIDATGLTASDKTDEIVRALVGPRIGRPLPRAGDAMTIFGRELEWRSIEPSARLDAGATHLWAFQLDVDRFVSGELQLEGFANARAFTAEGSIDGEDGKHALDLRNGSHAVWVVHTGSDDEQSPAISWKGSTASDRVRIGMGPDRRVSARQLTNAETVTAMSVSPDGRYLALAFDGRDDLADLDTRRLEIRDLDHDRIVQQWTGQRPSALAWSPDGETLAVQTGDSIWLHGTGPARPVLSNHEEIGSWRWHPDSKSILFTWTDKHDDKADEKRKRLRALEDHWANFRDNAQLFQVDATTGLIRPLTTGERSVTLHDVSEDGARVLLSERIIDYAEPPHSLRRIFELELDGDSERELARLREFNDIRFAEDGYWMLAGPGLSIGNGEPAGDATADDRTPNAFDSQLYRLDAEARSARSVSLDFDPSLSSIHRLVDGNLALTAVDGDRNVLVHFDAENERLARLDSGLEVVEDFVASETAPPVLIARGTDAAAPQRVHRLILVNDGGQADIKTLIDSKATEYAGVRFGEVRDWSFVNDSGDTIDGRYYLPPDFDPDQRYPLIVYYYGGTSPVNRQFTGRYPFNLWAAHGYVIYVLQPRGTVGYGQDFSALHVNAWGRYTADDILAGTDRFVDAHPFVDGERVGNIGASYGGFMTMHLATLTDRFAASISHAGISSLTSYWGEGWWGFGYSGIASRGSFPWNNRELYIDQSPIHSADKITTPLLLLHGDSDTNVPRGESRTMYTALKLLGRDVELVEFPGQDHWIVDREQRYVWWDTMLAWFDFWLKDEPEWWHHLYPETADES